MKKVVSLFAVIAISCICLLFFASCGAGAPVGLSLANLPEKRTVVQGCAPDLTGGTAIVEFENGDEQEIAMSELEIRGFNADVVGAQSLVLVYTAKGKSVSLVLDMTVVAPTAVSLDIDKTNLKSEYFIGESFDKESISVTAHYDNGTSAQIGGLYTVSPSTLELTTTEVTIRCGKAIEKIPVTVRERAPSSMEITRMPNKTAYFVGDAFLQEGLRATVTYNDGKTETFESDSLECVFPISEATYFGPSNTEEDTVKVIAHTKYGDISKEIKLKISEVLPESFTVTVTREYSFFEGDVFSFDNGEATVHVVYNNGTEDDLPANGDYFFYSDDVLGLEDTEAFVWMGEYDEVKATVPIKVVLPELISISISRSPLETPIVGRKVDLRGLILSLYMSNGRYVDLPYGADSGITAEPEYYAVDMTQIVIRYQGKETILPVDELLIP